MALIYYTECQKNVHTQNVQFYKFTCLCIRVGAVTYYEVSVHRHESLKIQIQGYS